MLKRVVLLMGETPASAAARHYAFRLAQTERAAVTGIAGIDLAFIEAPTPGGIGTVAYKQHMEAALKAQARETADRLRTVYRQDCERRGLPVEWLDFAGDPLGALKLAAESSDLLVTGHDTAFRGKLRERLPDTLATLCHMTPRPLVVCGDQDRSDGSIMIAHDGSLPAMRAMQLFTLLGLWRAHRVHLLAIGEDRAAAERLLASARRYLDGRGGDVSATALVTRVAPAEALRIEVADRGIGTLVMGVYGHRQLRDRLFGSTTTALLSDPPCALFVYH